MMTTSSVKMSPRPIPQFFNECNILATKKERYSSTPKDRKIPPRPPSKSISLYSRLSFTPNSSVAHQKAQIITFKNDDNTKLSSYYDETLNKSYFKQCFIIEKKIGHGSFGDVYKVKSREDNQYYAVKVSREKFKGKTDREEKLNEVCKHEQLPNHDHLVKFYCAWEERNRLYIQTELCSMSLSTLADNNHDIPEDTVWGYLIDLLKALDHLHSHNLIHLDIKPDNIFISRDGLCKLGDFGLIFDIENHNEATEGDPKYLASEIMQGTFTKSADIFSLGMTVLEIASDLDLPSRGECWHMLRSGNIPNHIFSSISFNLKTIISSMLNPNYKLRPTAYELLNHPIVMQHEKRRRAQLEQQKSFLNQMPNCSFNLKHDDLYRHNFWYRFWFNISTVINIILLPLRNVFTKYLTLKNHDTNSIQNSPVNLDRSNYISSYLDQYSDDDTNDYRIHSNLSFDSSISSDEEFLNENLSSRNLCSTVSRSNHPPKLSFPAFSPLFQDDGDGYHNSSIRNATQRLKFDEFSSDEMEMSENDDVEMDSIHKSNSISPEQTKNVINSSLRFNLSRKNLMKTFDEIDSDT